MFIVSLSIGPLRGMESLRGRKGGTAVRVYRGKVDC